MRPTLTRSWFWLSIVLGCVWLGAWALTLAQNWSGERFSSRDYLQHVAEPQYYRWGDQHPECRDRFGFWPDGTRMDAKEFNPYKEFFDTLEVERGNRKPLTPDEEARRDWAHDVRQRVASCEQDQWAPIAISTAIRNERLTALGIAFLPPISLLSGLGLMIRSKGNITSIAGKLLATVGAGCIAIVIAVLISNVGAEYKNFVLSTLFDDQNAKIRGSPDSLAGPRLDAVCAIIIPVIIVLWWRWPIPSTKRMNACYSGIAVGLVPVVIQILSWPFIEETYEGTWAAFCVAVFGTAVLSSTVTWRLLKSQHDVTATTVIPNNIRLGLVRLYAVLFVPWAIWFGYTAYEMPRNIRFDRSQLREYYQLTETLNDRDAPPAKRESARRYLSEIHSNYEDHYTNDELEKRIWRKVDESEARLTTAVYAVLAGLILPMLYPIVVWVLSGFRKSNLGRKSASPAAD
jgi:hypothetical protein